VSGERTAEEREAARLERARRRAAQEGRIEQVDQPPVGGDGEAPVGGGGEAPVGGGGDAPVGGDGEAPAGWDGEDPAEGDGEAPAGTKRVSWAARKPSPRKRPERSLRRRSDPSETRKRAQRDGPKRLFSVSRLIALIALVLSAAVIWFLAELFQPFHGSGHGEVTVTVPPHSSTGQIGDLLERRGVISSSFFFQVRALLAGDRGDLRSGTYQLKLDMSYGDVLSKLTTAPPPAKVTNLTIVEGRRRAEIASLLRAQGVKGNYLAATRSSPLINPRAYGAPRKIPSLEGFLFPSTYQLREPISASALVADQLKAFKQRFTRVNFSYAQRKHLTPYDVLIIASMIQGEAQTAHDMRLVASVIYNRLAKGMLLQIDATTRYAVGNFTQPLTVSQLASPSPYNTRVHKGLPPTPIDNPGMAAIQAAAHPARSNYLYFVVEPCGNGKERFASSYAQFLQFAQQYQSARAAHGGRSPAHC
jgi:UPF0755 protein